MIVEWFSREQPDLEWFGQTSGTIATVQNQGISAVASVVGPPGPSGSGGSAATYTHEQPVAAMVWTMDHGLGHWPIVVLLDENGQEIEGTVINPTLNRTTATFSEAIAGSARIF